MGRPSLKLAAEPLSPERQALAEAVAEAAPRRAALDQARARAEAARGALALAVAAGPAAERAVEEAKAHLIENPHAERATLRAARRTAADAADDLAIAREISARADAVEQEAERSARYAAERVEAGVSAVLVTAYPTFIEAAERAARDAAALAYVAYWIGGHGNGFDGEAGRMTARAGALNPRRAFVSDDAAGAVQAAAQAPWHAARAALLIDPSAPFPAL